MKNKRLEQRLKKSGFSGCIPIIEICEKDKAIKEIEVDKEGFTDSQVLNRMIETYLGKFDINVKYVDVKKRIQNIAKKSKVHPPVAIKKVCNNVVHQEFKIKMSVEAKKKMYTDYKLSIFSVSDEAYVVCPDCNNFEKL
jgi:hypothetical protein